MKCPQCQSDNPEGAKYCNECGHYLIPSTKATPQSLSFDEKLERLQRYLPQGLTEKILTLRDRIEGERKQVTVMFCDMEGFTPLVERLGPEETYLIMNQVYEILIHQVNDFEGTVNEMTGDGIMALFGAPIALEEASQRALWSALSIHREIAEFNDRKKKFGPIGMRIGIHSGPVVVGTLGNDLRVEFKAVGDTVNLASRMESLAEPGTTCVTEEIFRLTKDFFKFERLGKRAVKGKVGAIPVYKVLSGKQDVYRPRLGSERMIFSRMVGRSSELDRLELQVMKVINGAGSIVNIIGEAGIGKSRLLAELKKCEVMKKVAFLEGKAVSMGKNLSFYPIIDILKQWAQIRTNDREAATFNKLEDAVRGLFPDKVGEVLPSVATLMGIELPERYEERIKGIEGEALEKLILKNMRELLIKANRQTPLVIVMEDLHWADLSSIELMQTLFRLAETQRILFINLLRPGYKETGDRIVETIKETHPVYYVEIVIKPLDEIMSNALITNMLNITGLHPALIGQIIRRTGGNPYFIEEVVRSFIDVGAFVLRNGKFEATEKIGTITIPNTINDVLMARIDRLEVQARDLVKVASVIGRNFFYRILSEVANTVQNIDDRLSYLKEIELIRERRRMEELEYLFKHALAQEAAYESILPQKRKELHLKVADSIEKIFSEKLHEFYGMLAYHCSRGENLDKAEEYLLKAGEEALKSSASNEALHYYEEALNLYLQKDPGQTDPEKAAMLEKNIALALYNRGQYAEAVEYFDKALNYYWGKLPQNVVSTLFKFSSAFLHFLITVYLPSLKFRKAPTPRDTESIDLFYKKIKALSMIDAKRFFLEYFYLYKTVTNFDLTEFESGFEAFAGASSLFSFTGISFGWSRKILNIAKHRAPENGVRILLIYDLLDTIHNYLEGNWHEIRNHNDDLVNNSLNNGDLYDAALNLYWHGFPHIYHGSFDLAQPVVDKLDEISKVYDHDHSKSLKFELNTALLLECRKLSDALIEIEEGINFAQKAGLSNSLLDLYPSQAWIHILMGDVSKAEQSLKHAHKIRSEVDTPVAFQISHFCRSQLGYDLFRLNESVKSGHKSESSEYRKQAFKSCKMLLKVTQKAAQHRTESYRLTGSYYWLIKKRKKALKWWDKAIEEGKRLGARLALSRTYFEIGKRFLEADSKHKMLNGIHAEEYLEKARLLFEEMNLQWDLDELDRLDRG
jgi:class 3 adenylate cyclase/tetratricopeptide (TPR) repeat protein